MTYNPNLGRWLEVDPTGFNGGDVNLYRIEGNNPVNEVDPNGLEGFYSDGGYLQWKRDQEVARMRFYKTPESGSRFEFQSDHVMTILGFRQYTSILPWDYTYTAEYMKFGKGCIGLLYIRLNSPDNGHPWSLPGTKAFNNIDSAIAEQKQRTQDLKKDEVAVLYAIQTTNDKHRKNAIRPGSNEYDLSKLKLPDLGDYNFASAAQTTDGTIRFWEWMGGGEGENPELIVKHGAELPKDDGHGNPYQEENTIYVVVTIKKHDRSMPAVK